MKRIIFLSLIMVISLFLSGCIEKQEHEGLTIVTTIYPLAEFAKEVGGDKVKVSMLLPPGAEAHTYDPRPSDIVKVNNADIFIYIGEEMEPWAEKILKSAKKDLIVIEAIDFVSTIIEDEHHHGHHHHNHGHNHHEIEEIIKEIDHIIHEWEDNEITADKAMHEIEELIHKFLEHEHNDDDHHHNHGHHDHEIEEIIKEIDHIIHEWEDNEITADKAMYEIEELIHKFLEHEHNDDDHHHNHGHNHHEHEYDPHIWLDFNNNIDIINAIANKLIELNKENEIYYKNNAQNYIQRLKALDELFLSTLQNCNNRLIISAGHNIFAYLERKYNFESVTAYGLSPDSEPTPQNIKNMVDLLNENNLNYILFEEMINPRLAETIAKDTNAKALVFNPAENIARDSEGKTFIEIMQSNLETLKTAMDCN